MAHSPGSAGARSADQRSLRALCFFALVIAPDGASTSDASIDFITVPEDTEERRAFLQSRIALFGRMLAVITSIFLFVSASSYFALTPNPSIALRLSRPMARRAPRKRRAPRRKACIEPSPDSRVFSGKRRLADNLL